MNTEPGLALHYAINARARIAHLCDLERQRKAEIAARLRQRLDADERRQQLYRDAKRASFGCRVTQTITLQILQRHIVDLAVEAPEITIAWMGAGSKSRALTLGLARFATRSICVPALATHADYWTSLHELGHLRAPQARSRTRMQREIDAWRWCLSSAKVWDHHGHDVLRTSLRSYIAESDDPFAVVAAEHFIVEASHARARAIPSHELAGLERQLFQERFGVKRCGAGCCTATDAPAVALVGSTFCCRQCAPLVQARLDIRRNQHRTSRRTSV